MSRLKQIMYGLTDLIRELEKTSYVVVFRRLLAVFHGGQIVACEEVL